MVARRGSKGAWRLAMFFGLLLIPVALVMGPFRESFFPARAGELAALAALDPPPFDLLRLQSGPDLPPAALKSLRQAYESRASARLEEWSREHPGLGPGAWHLCWAFALLSERRPGPALILVEPLLDEADPWTARPARWIAAQAHLLLGQGPEAAEMVSTLCDGAEPFGREAARLAGHLEALGFAAP